MNHPTLESLAAENRALRSAKRTENKDDVSWRVEAGLPVELAQASARHQVLYHALKRANNFVQSIENEL